MKIDKSSSINIQTKEYSDLVKESLNLKLDGVSTITSHVGDSIFNARITTKNIKLYGTPYLYTESKNIFHFTSLKNLYSIINENSLRLYNLANSRNDPEEYNYAAKKINDIYKLQGFDISFIENEIRKIKINSFILSCTNEASLSNGYFWQEYGNKGKGVALELEIVNNIVDWEYFYCSKVQYEKMEFIDNLESRWKNIQKKYSNNIFKVSLNQILSLHKDKKWSKENEIRLLTLLIPDYHYFYPYNENLFKNQLFMDVSENCFDSNIKYFKLPLSNESGDFLNFYLDKESQEFWSMMPRIRISRIHLGPNVPFKNSFNNYKFNLCDYIKNKMNNSKVEIIRNNTIL